MLARTDFDTVETGEWLDSLRAVLHYQGAERAAFLLEKLTDEAQQAGVSTPLTLNTPYVNTISPEHEERANWDRAIEHRVPRAMGTSSPEFFLAPGATTLGLIKMRKHKRIVAYGVRPPGDVGLGHRKQTGIGRRRAAAPPPGGRALRIARAAQARGRCASIAGVSAVTTRTGLHSSASSQPASVLPVRERAHDKAPEA